MMMTRILWIAAVSMFMVLGCNETVEVGGGDAANNTSNNAPNNSANNTPNNGVNNASNNAANNGSDDEAPINNDQNNAPEQFCTGGTAFVDEDDDGFGADETIPCEEGQELSDGQVGVDGDCGPVDPLRHPGAEGVCGDFVDDDCDGGDEDCPESQPSMAVPDWDCTGEPPSSVVAWARFDSGEGFFQDGGCFFFFEGSPGQFFVKRNVERANDDPSCESLNGCTCPSLNGWPSYDRRMYAFTTSGPLEDCAEISIQDHGGESQPVSNACRKYLYQMHFYDIPYSFVSSSLASLERRLELFSTVEIACVEDAPHRNLPFQSLIQATIQRNPGFIAR